MFNFHIKIFKIRIRGFLCRYYSILDKILLPTDYYYLLNENIPLSTCTVRDCQSVFPIRYFRDIKNDSSLELLLMLVVLTVLILIRLVKFLYFLSLTIIVFIFLSVMMVSHFSQVTDIFLTISLYFMLKYSCLIYWMYFTCLSIFLFLQF